MKTYSLDKPIPDDYFPYPLNPPGFYDDIHDCGDEMCVGDCDH